MTLVSQEALTTIPHISRRERERGRRFPNMPMVELPLCNWWPLISVLTLCSYPTLIRCSVVVHFNQCPTKICGHLLHTRYCVLRSQKCIWEKSSGIYRHACLLAYSSIYLTGIKVFQYFKESKYRRTAGAGPRRLSAGTCHQSWWLRFNPSDSRDGKGEPTPARCPVTSHMCSGRHPHSTHKH